MILLAVYISSMEIKIQCTGKVSTNRNISVLEPGRPSQDQETKTTSESEVQTNRFADLWYSEEEIVDMYNGVCDPSTTVAPTTEPTLINKCGDLPDVEVGFWTCHDTVCVLECAAGQIAHINLALQGPVYILRSCSKKVFM